MIFKKLLAAVVVTAGMVTSASAVTINSGAVLNLAIVDDQGATTSDPLLADVLSLDYVGNAYTISAFTNPTLSPQGVELQQTFLNNTNSYLILNSFTEIPIELFGVHPTATEFMTATVRDTSNVVTGIFPLIPINIQQGVKVNPGETLTLNWGGTQVFTNGDFSARVEVAPVPVPAGILLMGTALAGFGVMRRRKKAAA